MNIEGAGAIGDAAAALEQGRDRGMGLEALKFLERRKVRILVIEMNDKADRNQIVVVVIEKRAATG